MTEYGPSSPAARAPVTDYASSSRAGACAARAPVTDYASTSPAGSHAAPASVTNSLAPETEVASSPPAAAYASLATKKKRLVWAALEDGHLDIHEANEILADVNAEALLLEEEQEARQTAKKEGQAQ